MKIGVIGAGNIGATLARKLVASGHEVKISNSKAPETIRDIARQTGAKAVSKEAAVRDVEIIILSIPFAKYPDVAPLFKSVPETTIVIDTSNYYPFRDGTITEVENGKPESVWVSEQIGRSVVKAWNAILAVTLAKKGQSNGTAGRIAAPVAGDDPQAKTIVGELVNATGFDAVDSGGLQDSWRQQPGTPAYCTERTTSELIVALQSADKVRAPEFRDALIRQFMEAGDKLTHNDVVARNRAGTA